MTDKGLVERGEGQPPPVYRPRLSREPTERRLVCDHLDRAFASSAKRMMSQALAVKKASVEEPAEIGKLLDRLEEAVA